MENFPRSFADRADVLLSRQRELSKPIALRLAVRDITPNIMCARAHLKSVTFPKHFSIFDILWAYDQCALERFGVIPPSHSLAC